MHIFQTTEGEAISKFISGYVDITLKSVPVYETIPDNPVEGVLPRKQEVDSDGYVAITNCISNCKVECVGQLEVDTDTGVTDLKNGNGIDLNLVGSIK